MQTGSRLAFFVLVCISLAASACSPGSGAQGLGGVTASPVSEDTTNPTGPPAAALSEAEILEIVRASLAAFPWRMEQSVLVKEPGQTIESLTEAQSSTRGYNRSEQSLGAETITLESILVDSQVYLKISGSPAATYGLVDGQWTEVLPDSPLLQFVDTGAIDPARLAEIFARDFRAVSGESGGNELTFEAAGMEEVNGTPTTVYEASGPTFSYRWWIGADGRFYKSTMDIPLAERTILVEYDPGITVQPPVP